MCSHIGPMTKWILSRVTSHLYLGLAGRGLSICGSNECAVVEAEHGGEVARR
jgi:hypothetical protein